jgi:hypothetical protein
MEVWRTPLNPLWNWCFFGLIVWFIELFVA